MKQLLFSILFLYLLIPFAFAQVEIYTSGNELATPDILIQNYFANNGIVVTNTTYTGDEASLGLFNNADPNIGIEDGIALSTGFLENIFSVNCNNNASGISLCNNAGNNGVASNDSSGGSDSDLSNISGVSVSDASIIEIEFIPQSDSIEFTYLFASEEYENYTCSSFNDIFGLFLSGPGISGPYSNNATNIALIPGTNLPVSINTLNGGIASGVAANCDLSNSQFFVNNISAGLGIEMNGLTVSLKASAAVVPGQIYKLKIAIGDGGDDILDSSILLQVNSFHCPNLNQNQVNISSSNLSGNLTENCNPTEITLSIPHPFDNPTNIPFSITGTAALDTDFTMSTNTITIPAGSTSTSFVLEGIEDQVVEGDEDFQIVLELDPSNPQIIPFTLLEESFLDSFEYDNVIANCEEDSIRLSLVNSSPQIGGEQKFTNNANLTLPANVLTYLPVDVTGYPNNTIEYNTSISIYLDCGTTVLHELVVWLISPDGKIIHLTSFNGFDTDFENTYGAYHFKFNQHATQSITELVAPFGYEAEPEAWLPEGDLSILNGSPINGNWRLAIQDTAPGFTPLIKSWSVSFEENQYNTYYDWSPNIGMDCSTCAEPMVEISGEQMYYVTITDTHGCEKTDSVLLTISDFVEGAVIDSSTVMDEGCDGELGSIDLFVSGDYESLTWNTGQDSTSINNLLPGTYTVTIANTCEADLVASYIIEPGLEYQLSSTEASCGGTGSATVTSTATYDVTWSNGATGNFADNLSPGIYYATISNNNCSSVATVEIVEFSGCTPDISGTVFLEQGNMDCVSDTATIPYQYAMISLTGNGTTEYTFTNPDGTYIFNDVSVGDYDVVLESFGPENTVLCPTSDTIPVDIPVIGNDYPNNDYWLINGSSLTDLTVNIISFVPPRPDQPNVIQINCSNNGGQPAIGNTVVFQHPTDQVFIGLSSSHAYTYDPVTYEITISLPDLEPGAYEAVIIDFNTPISAVLGDVYTYNVEVSSSSDEIIIDNNTNSLSLVVVNSYDPNDKQVSPIGMSETGGIRPEETLLTYKIRFQNEGTADALKVVLKDEIDTDVFDFTSIKFLESSHDFTADVEGSNILVITYDDINLVPKSVSEAESQGYIIFEIRLKDGLPLGMEIKNDAEIFFDTNDAIVTNETLNTIEDVVAVDNIWLKEINMYPNPAKDKLFITSDEHEINHVQIMDGLGQVVLMNRHFSEQQYLDLSSLGQGLYFVQIKTTNGQIGVSKLTVMK